MRITQYDSVNSLNSGDVFLIDGERGTKKLTSNADVATLTTSFTSSDDVSESGIIMASGETSVSKITSGDTFRNQFLGLSKVSLNMRKLINTAKRVWNMAGAAWVSGKAYAVNNEVIYTNGYMYRCIKAHTSSSSILPTNTTYWTNATIAEQLTTLFNKIPTLIWNNSNPSVGFSGQKLTWSIPYNYYKIIFTSWGEQLSVDFKAGNNSRLFNVVNTTGSNSGGSPVLFVRPITASTAYSITFDNAYDVFTADGAFEKGDRQNTYIIPLYIFGYNVIF